MSFTLIDPATPRLHRSELAVPGSNTAMFEKAAASAADIIFLDLEDAVAPDDKEKARTNIIAAKRLMAMADRLTGHAGLDAAIARQDAAISQRIIMQEIYREG